MPLRSEQQTRNEKNLVGVHPDLARVIRRALAHSPVNFIVTEGLRTIQRQIRLVKTGKSTTMKSRHLTGHAVDVVPVVAGKIDWSWDAFHQLAPHIKSAAQAEGVTIEWGGDWRTFKDGPHWQLPWREYP